MRAPKQSINPRPPVAAKFRVPSSAALVRRRVLDALTAGPTHRLVLLVAPAGAGKTTAMAQFAQSVSDRRVAWYRAERTEADAETFLAHLEHAVRGVVPDLEGGWSDPETAAQQLAVPDGSHPCVLVIDDLHELRHSVAEQALERLLDYLPGWLTVLAASRHEPGFNLSRLRVSGQVVEVAADVLRWRHWEVERLFREVYEEPLRPEDAARLTQRTEGWAAGLQLFHLATRELPLSDRRQLVDDLHTRPGLVREYLTRNVLDRLPSELYLFLVDTCVLGRLQPTLCDRLRERTDSAGFLAELVRRRLFTVPCEDGRGYRYHEVLRAHLELALLERDGTGATRQRFARAGQLLEQSGTTADAVHAYARAEAWDDVARLLGTSGRLLADRSVTGLQRLPEALLASDPWLQLARSRMLARDGQLDAAAATYQVAEAAFGDAPGAQLCRQERAELRAWIDPQPQPRPSAVGLLRAATLRDPRGVIAEATASGTPHGLVVAALAATLAGDLREAARLARDAVAHPDAEHAVVATGRVIGHLGEVAAGAPLDRVRLHGAADALEQIGWTWVARLVRLVADLATGDDGLEELRALCVTAELYGDRWGPPLAALLGGAAAVATGGDGRPWLAAASGAFRRLRAPVLEVWAEAWLAAASVEDDPARAADCRTRAERARSSARKLIVPGAEALADLVLARLRDDEVARRAAASALTGLGWERAARVAATSTSPPADGTSGAADEGRSAAGNGHGPAGPETAGRPAGDGAAIVDLREPTMEVACFGGLRLRRDGVEVELGRLRPQTRFLLGRLASPAGVPAPREQLIEELWPEAGPERAHPKLQVLVSTLRRFLEPDAERGDWALVRRTSEAYVLQLPDVAHSDVAVFEGAVAAARQAHLDRDDEGELRALRLAFEVYDGDLLPELGHGEWISDARGRYRSEFAQAAQGLAERLLAADEPEAGIGVAEAGLRADRYRTRLWKALATAYRLLGDPAAVAMVEAEYAGILTELGLPAGVLGETSAPGTAAPAAPASGAAGAPGAVTATRRPGTRAT